MGFIYEAPLFWVGWLAVFVIFCFILLLLLWQPKLPVADKELWYVMGNKGTIFGPFYSEAAAVAVMAKKCKEYADMKFTLHKTIL